MPDLMQESDENKIRIAKELLLEEVHRLQEERSAFEKERDKTMEKLKEQESFFDKKFKILEMGFAQLDADRKSFEAKKRAFEYSRQFYQEKQEKGTVFGTGRRRGHAVFPRRDTSSGT